MAIIIQKAAELTLLLPTVASRSPSPTPAK